MQFYGHTSRTTEEMLTSSSFIGKISCLENFTLRIWGHYKDNFACLSVCYIMSVNSEICTTGMNKKQLQLQPPQRYNHVCKPVILIFG